MTVYVLGGIIVAVLIAAIIFFVSTSKKSVLKVQEPSTQEVIESIKNAESEEIKGINKAAKEASDANLDSKIARARQLANSGRRLRD